MSGGNPRRPRVSQAIREALGTLVGESLHDPRLQKAGFLSVNHVELNRDMSVAEVFVAFYGGEDAEAETAVSILNRSAGRLRGPLGRKLKLQRAPELRFVHDRSSEFGVRLSQIIRDDESRSTQGNPGEPTSPEETGDSGDE
jgi:ribosome-binding factor A